VSEVGNPAPTFLSLYGTGQVAADKIDDFIEAWHISGDEEQRGLAEYLGISDAEYSVWLMSHGALPSILAARREGRPLTEVIAEYFADLQCTCPSDRPAIHALSHWLGRHHPESGGTERTTD
jgi:hypothetical protein